MFYVYEWFDKNTNKVFYVGKGTRNRYKVRKHNKFFNHMINTVDCESRIVKYFETEGEAFDYEYLYIKQKRKAGECLCNIYEGGTGGTVSWWDDKRRKEYSEKNVMKSQSQRKRMSENNPMKDKNIALKMGAKHMRAVVINHKIYPGVKIAAKEIGVCEYTISTWCRRGYDINGNPCRYEDEEQKEYSELKKMNPRITTAKPVIIDGIRFLTLKQGAEYIGVASETLIRCIKSNKDCKGHKCRYDNQQPSQRKSGNSTLEGSTTNE